MSYHCALLGAGLPNIEAVVLRGAMKLDTAQDTVEICGTRCMFQHVPTIVELAGAASESSQGCR
jgi:hypothetical protein